tara:strand:- start:132 stop:569 length:438 start_codon:yes stop_codon:yes gene_type:complete
MFKLDYLHYILYFLIGTLSGISMGIVGVGAGMLTIPLLIYTGLTIKESVGISLIMQLLPQSLPGVIMYYKNGAINLPTIIIAMFVVIGSLVGIYFGAFLVHNNFVNLKAMYSVLAFLLIGSGLYIVRTYIMNDAKILEERTVTMD